MAATNSGRPALSVQQPTYEEAPAARRGRRPVITLRCRTVCRAAGILLAASAFVVTTPASAEGLFDALFGGMFRSHSTPRETSAYAEPTPNLFGNERPAAT